MNWYSFLGATYETELNLGILYKLAFPLIKIYPNEIVKDVQKFN